MEKYHKMLNYMTLGEFEDFLKEFKTPREQKAAALIVLVGSQVQEEGEFLEEKPKVKLSQNPEKQS